MKINYPVNSYQSLVDYVLCQVKLYATMKVKVAFLSGCHAMKVPLNYKIVQVISCIMLDPLHFLFMGGVLIL